MTGVLRGKCRKVGGKQGGKRLAVGQSEVLPQVVVPHAGGDYKVCDAATVLAAMGAREADPHQYQQLYNIVQALAIGDGLPLPKVYVMDDPSPNAFATGRDPNHASITVTSGLLQMMNREELEGVLAHEMSHIKNFDVRMLLVVTTMIGMAALIASVFWHSVGRIRFSGRNSGQLALIVFAIGILFSLVAFIVGPIMQLALSRQRESLADVVNRSINQTLSRTVLTSGLTFLTVLSLFLFGGEVLHGFSLALVIGIVIGTYSSIFIASPMLVAYQDWRANRTARPAVSAGGRAPNARPAKPEKGAKAGVTR